MNPFTPKDYICDSSLFDSEIVEHTTSWLTINPMKGCSLDCAYCFRYKWDSASVPYLANEVQESLEQLIKHNLFIPHVTPISVNISSTDSLLPTVKESTFECIKFLDKKGLKNIFGITTKIGFSLSDIKFLKSIKNLRIITFISYANIPKEIEPVSQSKRLDSLKLLKKAEIPVILYARPIVPGWNNDDHSLSKILLIGEQYADAICIGGIRLSNEILDKLNERKIKVPEGYTEFHPKRLENELEILNQYERLHLTVPLFKHTSCAVSFIFKIPNYNMLYENSKINCLSTCPIYQKNICSGNSK